MGIQINGNTNNINAGIGSLSIEDINELYIVGVATAANFKTGSSNLHTTGLTVGNNFFHSTGINVGTGATIHVPSSNVLTLGTNSNERFRIADAASTFQNKLIIDDGSNGHLFLNNTSSENTIHSGTTGFAAYKNLVINAAQHIFKISNTERLRIDSSGRLLVGGTGNTESDIRLYLHNPSAAGSQLQFTGNGSGTGNSDGFRVGYNGSGGQLWLFENQFVRIATNNTERLRIDSSGHVGIGTDNPAVSLQGNWNKILEVSAGIHTGSMIRFTESGVGGGVNKGMLVGEHDNNAYLINYQNGFLQFRTNGIDRGRFDAAGRLLIGDSSVEGWSPDADDFTISNTGANCGMTIRSNASGYSSIFFSDATSGTGEYDGFLQYGHSAQRLSIGAGSATKMSILNNGHVTTQGNNNGNQ